jgi:hypothetical protein
MTRIGNSHRIVTRKDGRTVLVQVKKRYDVSTELRLKNSKRVRVVAKRGRP